MGSGEEERLCSAVGGSRERTRTGRKKPGRQETQRRPSSERPPPGAIM